MNQEREPFFPYEMAFLFDRMVVVLNVLWIVDVDIEYMMARLIEVTYMFWKKIYDWTMKKWI